MRESQIDEVKKIVENAIAQRVDFVVHEVNGLQVDILLEQFSGQRF